MITVLVNIWNSHISVFPMNASMPFELDDSGMADKMLYVKYSISS